MGGSNTYPGLYRGSPSAMDKALKIPGIDPLAKTASQETVLHCAAWGGSPSAMDKALKIPGIDPLAKTASQQTVLHCAAWSGSPSAMDEALKIPGIDPLAKTASQETVLHFAAWSGSPSAVMYLRICSKDFDLGLDPRILDNAGHDAFWYAGQSKNTEGVSAALRAPINILRVEHSTKEAKEDDSEPEKFSNKRCAIM